MYLGLGKRYDDLFKSKISFYLSAGVDTRKREHRSAVAEPLQQ